MKKFILNLSYIDITWIFAVLLPPFKHILCSLVYNQRKLGSNLWTEKKSLDYIELIKSAIILFLYTRKWKKECKVSAAIELSAAMWQTEYNGVVAFFRLDLVTTFSGFQFFLFFLATSLPVFHFENNQPSPKVDSSLFLFCLPKKIKRINFHLKQKIHNPRPRSSSLNITQISPLSPHVTFFTTTQSKLTPSYFLNWLKLKSMYLHL